MAAEKYKLLASTRPQEYGDPGNNNLLRATLPRKKTWRDRWRKLHWGYHLVALLCFLGGIATAISVPLTVELSGDAVERVIGGGIAFSLIVAIFHLLHVFWEKADSAGADLITVPDPLLSTEVEEFLSEKAEHKEAFDILVKHCPLQSLFFVLNDLEKTTWVRKTISIEDRSSNEAAPPRTVNCFCFEMKIRSSGSIGDFSKHADFIIRRIQNVLQLTGTKRQQISIDGSSTVSIAFPIEQVLQLSNTPRAPAAPAQPKPPSTTAATALSPRSAEPTNVTTNTVIAAAIHSGSPIHTGANNSLSKDTKNSSTVTPRV